MHAERYASNHGAPKKSDIGNMEDIINRGAVMEFYEDSSLRDHYLDVLHEFVILAVRDRKMAEEQLAHPVHKKSIFEVVNPRMEAFVYLVLVNNVDGWSERLNSSVREPSKKCVGRWTKVHKESGDTKNHGRLTNCSGWNSDGLGFYEKCKTFFKNLRDVEDEFQNYHEDAIHYYYKEYEAPRLMNAKNKSRKRARAMAARAHEDAPDYGEMNDWDM